MLRYLYDVTHGAEKAAVVIWAILMFSGLSELSSEGPTTLYVALLVGLFVCGHIAITAWRSTRQPLATANLEDEQDDDPTEPLPIIPESSIGIISVVPSVTSAGPRYDSISVLYLGQSFVWVRPHGVVQPGVPVDFMVDTDTSDIELLAGSQP